MDGTYLGNFWILGGWEDEYVGFAPNMDTLEAYFWDDSSLKRVLETFFLYILIFLNE
jgi:hypothetical protein